MSLHPHSALLQHSATCSPPSAAKQGGLKLQQGLVMRSNQEQAFLPHWGPVPTALMLPEHHSANSAAQLGGRKQGTSQGDKRRSWRGITCIAGAVDEAGQRPGKERHSPHSSNVQEGTCCLGRQKQTGCQTAQVPVPKIHMLQCQGPATAASTAGRSSVPGREGQAPGGQNRLPALVQPPFINLVADAPGRTARAEGAPCLARQQKSRAGN